MGFIMCLAKPIFSAIMGGMGGGSTVAGEVPFPDDEMDQVYDATRGSMVEVASCPDCLESDPRDLAAQSCVD